MGKVKKPPVYDKEDQKKISTFFQKSSEVKQSSTLFTQVGDKTSTKVVKRDKDDSSCSTASSRSRTATGKDVIVVSDNDDFATASYKHKKPDTGATSNKHFAQSKFDKAIADSTKIKSKHTDTKSENNKQIESKYAEVTCVPETQVGFTPNGKESINFPKDGTSLFQSPTSSNGDSEIIPDTPKDKNNSEKVKRPLGRSFLLSATHFASNPIQEAKENREAKLALKKKRASLAHKSLVSVSVNFNKPTTSDENKLKGNASPSIFNSTSDKAAQKQENEVQAMEADVEVPIDGKDSKQLLDQTPTKLYSEGSSIKRMAKSGLSPYSKRTANFDETGTNEHETDTDSLAVKQLNFGSVVETCHDNKMEIDEFTKNKETVEEMNSRVALELEDREKVRKEKMEKIERERQERLELKKQQEKEKRKKNSDKMMKYQLGNTGSSKTVEGSKASADVNDTTLDDILEELHSPSLLKGNKQSKKVDPDISKSRLNKDSCISNKLGYISVKEEGVNTSNTKTKNVSRAIVDRCKDKSKRYSLESVLKYEDVKQKNDESANHIHKPKQKTVQDINPNKSNNLVSKLANDWTADDEKYFSNLGVKTTDMDKENLEITDRPETESKVKLETKSEYIGCKSAKSNRKNVKPNTMKLNKKEQDFANIPKENANILKDSEEEDITIYPTPCFQEKSKVDKSSKVEEGSRSYLAEMEIEDFDTQFDSELLCDDLQNMSPFKKKKGTTEFQMEAPCLEFGRHLVTGVEYDSGKQQTILNLSTTSTELPRTCVLHGFWLDTHIQTGDVVNVLAPFVDGTCHITDKQGLIVVNPDLLLSGTTVVSSVFCMRKSILKEKFKGCDSRNVAMLYGSIIHSVFQEVLRKKLVSKESILQEAKHIVKQSGSLLEMYANKVGEDRVMEEIQSYIPQIMAWTKQYTNIGQDVMGNQRSSTPDVLVTKVRDIEENIWSPRFGIKGKIDLTVDVKIKNEKKVGQLPLELKTGKPSYSVEHKGQVTLYSMMCSDRREDPQKGLLLYLKEPSMKVIPADYVNQKGLIQLRNEMAFFISRQVLKSADDNETTFTLGKLPEPISNIRACQKCPQLINCAIHQKVVEGRSHDGGGMSGLVSETLAHLHNSHMTYFTQWCLMLDLESQLDQSKRTVADIWCKSSTDREDAGLCFSGMMMTSEGQGHEVKDDTIVLTFTRHHNNTRSAPLSGIGINQQDSVVISCEMPAWIAVCTGFVQNITDSSVNILTDSDAIGRLTDLKSRVFRIDKCDNFSTAGIFYTNISRLMMDDLHSLKLRSLIIDRTKPEFISTLSKGNIQKVKTVFKSLNKPQKTAILKVLMSKDYVLIKGFPGTGKTSTIVALVKVLQHLDMSVLLTSYTHSAVDNILLKLKKEKIKFLRLGRISKIHQDIKDHSADVLTRDITNTADLEQFFMSQRIVATSCLGTNHPIFTHRQFDVCIVDEASQVLQPACLGPLFSSMKFVLVGDPKQLPPVVQSKESKNLGMDESLFARLDGLGATFDLDLQYRMNSEIMYISNSLVYNGCLKCGTEEVATRTLQYPHVQDVEKLIQTSPWMSDVLDQSLHHSVVFLNTERIPAPEVREKGGVIKNKIEAQIVVDMVTAFVKAGVDRSDIGIIAPYRSQVYYIRQCLGQGHSVTSTVEVNTVDQYQGRDKCVIIISFVRSSDSQDSKTGELLKDLRRLNVAVTRARSKLVLIGNVATLNHYEPLKNLIKIVQDKNQISFYF